MVGVYHQLTRADTVFRGGNSIPLRYPRCLALARLPRLPCRPPFLLPKNSEGLSGEKKLALARPQDAGGLAPAKSENAVQRRFWPPESVFALVN